MTNLPDRRDVLPGASNAAMHSQETSEGASPPAKDLQAAADIEKPSSRTQPELPQQRQELQEQSGAAIEAGDQGPASAGEPPAARRIRIGSQRSAVARLKARPLSEPPLASTSLPQTARQKPSPQPQTAVPPRQRHVPPTSLTAAADEAAGASTPNLAEHIPGAVPAGPAAGQPPLAEAHAAAEVAPPPVPAPTVPAHAATAVPTAAVAAPTVPPAALRLEPPGGAAPHVEPPPDAIALHVAPDLAKQAAVAQPSVAEPTAPHQLPPGPLAGSPRAAAQQAEPEAAAHAAPLSPPQAVVGAPPAGKTPLPNLRAGLPPELEAEVQAALGGLSLEEVLEQQTSVPADQDLAPESRHLARVLRVSRDTVFVDLGGRNQGALPLQQLAEPPAEGAQIEVIISRFDPEEGLYQVTLPRAAMAVGDWSSVSEGMVVEARVTGVNKGGLECEVSNLRGFIPASHAAAWRVEDLTTLIGERLLCVVTEVDPERRKLVLSRRAMIEREREEARQKLRAELTEGQVREGVVRSLQDFGAFVDLGGVDGLIHVSQLSWQRVQHPSEVLHVGQRVKVKIRKYDPETGKLSLSLRDLAESPWATAAAKYPPTSRHQGTVTRLAPYGAFVELEPGLEGMVHISELAHGRVWRASDVVQPGQQVEVQVLAVDAAQQRISLSLKAAQPRPEKSKTPEPEPEEPEPVPPPPPRKTPLRGGLGRSSGGERFGLKW